MNIVDMVAELLQIIPPWLRKSIYALVVTLLVMQGAAAIWFDDPDPDWVRKSGDVLQYLAGFAVLMASANVVDVQGKHEA